MNQISQNLALAYQIIAFLGLDDHTYTHLSAKNSLKNFYYINPFGLRFEEITSRKLIKIDFFGNIIYGKHFNKTGDVIHRNIYNARSDINSIFHLHSPAITAVSAMQVGLLPISQWALHFYQKVSYYKYDSLIQTDKQAIKMIDSLNENYVMLMQNHGAIVCGRTIHEAMFYTYHLEQACKTQCLLSLNQNLIIPSDELCKQTSEDLYNFEKDLGKRDWNAWIHLVKKRKKL